MRRSQIASRWGGPLLQARTGSAPVSTRQPFLCTVRCQSSIAASGPSPLADIASADKTTTLPSPPISKARQSAKLAALHARLALPKRIPLETLARSLVTASADPNPNFNNSSLAVLGRTIIGYHVLEHLVCKWPRLPMTVLYEAVKAYGSADSLQMVARRWGLDAAAAPGEEVDPGLLQWTKNNQQTADQQTGYIRRETSRIAYRRGISSRIILDDEFGDKIQSNLLKGSESQVFAHFEREAYGSAVRAVVGAIYTHCGREAAKHFVSSHILSRQIDPSAIFQFNLPTRELAMLCAREGFEAPIARLESETGRHSRTPVFVVGIYSGKDKLGEAAGPSLSFARKKAAMDALRSWYLYSPGNKVRVPSDMMEPGANKWVAPHIDVGEVV